MDFHELWLIAAGLCLLASIAFAVSCRNVKQFLDEIWAVDMYPARELRLMCSGGFNATVEVEGDVVCEDPISALASQILCCWYHTTVQREVRKTRTVTETDSRGKRHTRTEVYYEWETDLDITRSTVFRVVDHTGYTLVDPDKATIDSVESVNKEVWNREPWFGRSVRHSDTGKYRIVERVFHPSGYVFVMGRASQVDNDAIVRYPDIGYLNPKKKHFIISRKTEKQLTQSKQRYAAVCFWFSVAFLLAAGACVFLAQRPGC